MAWPPRASVTVTVNEQWPLAGLADKVNRGVRDVESSKLPWQLRLHEKVRASPSESVAVAPSVVGWPTMISAGDKVVALITGK